MARDALIQADEILFDGNYTCALWRGFAEREDRISRQVVRIGQQLFYNVVDILKDASCPGKYGDSLGGDEMFKKRAKNMADHISIN
ncbi:hypothetical protein FS837_013007 [Tulasnella sp. UAMH 9824]|nr:hypothetical protein FS837_013007 [Tulasnella sp. UAMH 9824]